jgi:hypothetical protein
LIDAGAAYVVMADITAFYENIDLGLLLSDLIEAINQISSCLNKWAQVQGRGIPQGQSPSDILAKLYLNSIDQTLKGSDKYRDTSLPRLRVPISGSPYTEGAGKEARWRHS